MPSYSMSNAMQDCIRVCLDTHRMCTETLNYCLERGGRYSDPAYIRMLTDCAEICQTAANFMLRNSDLHMAVCSACAEVCDSCADDFEQFEDDRLQACADLCRQCADSCDEIAEEPETIAA
jgi:hypothetical protein